MTFVRIPKLIPSAMGALLVIAGVVIKNTFEQLKQKDNPMGVYGGWTFFVLGWLTTGYAISLTQSGAFEMNLKSLVAFTSCAGVIISVYAMKSQMKQKKKPHMALPLVFVASWLGLAYAVSLNCSITAKIFAFSAAILVFLSMMWALPEQRKKCIVDGPGMPMFCLAWVLVVGVNSVF